MIFVSQILVANKIASQIIQYVIHKYGFHLTNETQGN